MTSIPDAISSDALKSLLSNDQEAPISELIPELNFGNAFGGPCDLQFVISSIIAKSVSGVNLIQLLMASLHLLCEAERHMLKQHKALLDEDSKFSSLPEDERRSLARITERHHIQLKSAVMALEQILDAYAPMSSHVRVDELIKSGTIKRDSKLPGDQLRSILLISDELLETLNLTREEMTHFLSNDIFQTP